MSKKHTPGPWSVQPWKCHAATSVMAGNIQIAECSGLGRHSDDCLDDASLIAAAPELLDALVLLVAGIENSVSDTYIPLRKARSAIAKATGEA